MKKKKKKRRQFYVQEQLAHCSKLKVMTEKPETDVNKDYNTIQQEKNSTRRLPVKTTVISKQ